MKGTEVSCESERVEQARRGDQAARSALVESHYAPVCSLAYKLTGRPDLARDVAQETFLRAFLHLEQHDPQYSFRSWVFRIASNHVRDLLRRELRGWKPPLAEPDPGAETILERREDLARVRAALKTLPVEYRLPLVLHLQEGLPIREIVYALESTEHAVRMKIYRGLIRIRAMLREDS